MDVQRRKKKRGKMKVDGNRGLKKRREREGERERLEFIIELHFVHREEVSSLPHMG